MNSKQPFRRRWGVTLARGGVALALAFGLATWLAYANSVGEPVSIAHILQICLAITAAPAAWLIPFGLYADHRLSSWGMGVSTLVHALGGVLGLFLAMLYGAIYANIANGQGPGETGFLFILAIPVWMVAGCLAAWLVPGSFPPRHARVRREGAVN